MEKKTLRTANWLKSVFLLAVMLIGAFSASANITQEMSLGELRSGSSYNVPANTHATGYFTAPSDGTVILTSNVDANTNLTPYYDSEYTEVVSTERDELAKTKSFEAVSGTTYYFAATTSPTTSFEVLFTFKEKKPIPEYVYPVGITPEDGATVAELSTIKMKMSTRDFNLGKNRYAVVYNSSDVQVSAGILAYDSDDNYAIVINLSPAVKTDGEYKVVILEEAYRVQGVLNPELTYNYTVDSSMGGGDELNVTYSPALEEPQETLSTIIMTFPDYAKYYMMVYSDKVISVTKDGVAVDGLSVSARGDMGGKLSLELKPALTESGEYVFTVPAGMVSAYDITGGGEIPFPEMTFAYTVNGTVEPEPEPEPTLNVTYSPALEEPQETLSTIIMTFPDYAKYYMMVYSDKVISVTKDGVAVDGLSVSARGDMGGKLSLELKPALTESGEYLFTVPAGMVSAYDITGAGEIPLPEMTFAYTVNGTVEPEPEPTPTINMSFEPNPEEVQTSLAKVVVKFPDLGSDKFVIANVTTVNVYDANGNIVGEGELNGGSQVEVYLVPEIKESGVYTIKFNDSDLMVYKGDNIPAFEVTYTVEAPELPVATWSIAEGAVVDNFESVTLTFEGVESASTMMYVNAFYSVAEDGTATLVQNYCSEGVMDASAEGASITFSIDRECYMNLYGGNYRIIIPVGSVKFNGDKTNTNTEEYVLNFTLDAPGAPVEVDAAFTANPENNATVSELKEVVLTFTDYESISLAEPDMVMASNIPQVYMEDDLTGGLMPAGHMFFEAGSAPNELRLYVEPNFNGGMDSYALEGSYVIRIPAGVVTFTDGVSKEIVLNYTVKAAPSITATWSIAEGAVVDNFESVTLTFEGVESASTMMYVNAFYSVAEDGTATLVQNYCSEGVMDASAEGASITFSIDRECYMNLYGGNYRIIIPVGSVKFNGDKTNTNTEEYVLNFTLDAPGAPVEVDAAFTANPENNATVSELKEVVLTFTDYESISLAEPDMVMASNIPQVYMEDDLTGGLMPAGYMFFEAGSAPNELRLYVEPNFNGGMDSYALEGSYVIRIPAGVVTFTDGVSKEIILNYTVKANVEEPTGAPIAVSPEAGTPVESLSEIELTFDKNYYVSGEVVGNWTPFPAVYNESGEKVEGVALSWGYNEDALNSLKLKLNPALTESGTYTIKFPEGAVTDFYDSSISSPEFELTYTVEAPVVGGLPVAYEPEVGSEVSYLTKVTLYFAEEDYPNGIDVTYFGTPEVYKDGQLIETNAYYAYDQYDYYKGYIEFLSPLTEAGTYTIKVKAGHFYEYLNESNAVPAFEMTYVVTGGGYVNNNPGPIAVIPASGSEVKEINTISINFAEEDYPNGMDANSSTAVPVLNAAGEEVGKLKLQYDPDNYFAVKCTVLGGEPITAPGEYTIVIPEGHIWEYNGNKLETAVPEIVLTYTIKGEGVEEEVRLSSTVPAEGELDMSLYAGVFQGISLYFSEVVSMIADDQLPADMITIAKDGVVVEEKSLTKLVNDPFGDGNKVDLVFEKYSKAGEYVITIPGGWATYADGTVVGDIVLTYIIPENTDTNDFITDPEAGVVESLSKVWFQLTNRTYAAKNSYTSVPGYQWYGKPYVIDDATGEKVTDCYFYKEEDHCAFGIDLNKPIVTSGSYTLVIPQGQIAYVQKQKDLTEDEVNPEFRIQYTIEGEDPQYFPVTVNPEEGVVESLSVVTVTFAEGVTLELDENSSSYPRFYEVTENGDEFVRNGDFSVSGNVFTFSVYTDEETGELDAITEAGEYAFIIPVGLIKVDGVFTTEYRFEYQIGGATAALTITDPVPGTTVERLSQFTVVAPGATTLEQNETRRTIQLVKNEELVSNVTVLSTEGNTAVLQLSNVVTESGDYTLIIPPYFFLADGVEIEEQHTFNYTVLNDAPVFKKPTINPEEGLVEEFTEFVLTWEDVTEIVLDNSVMMGTSGIAMYDAMNEKVSDFIGMPSGDNAVMLNFMGAAPAEPGEYRLVIPAGMFTVDGATNHEMEFFYMYIPAIDFEITIDKSGTVESVEEFVLSFNPCEESVEINSECEESIGLWTAAYPEELVGYFEVTIEGLTAKLELTVDPITVEDGDYTILVPQDYFFVDGMPCGGETFNVTLVKSGIYGIEADAQGLNVYSVSGILVLRDAKATELKNLQKGIYIVNGKKVLVR